MPISTSMLMVLLIAQLSNVVMTEKIETKEKPPTDGKLDLNVNGQAPQKTIDGVHLVSKNDKIKKWFDRTGKKERLRAKSYAEKSARKPRLHPSFNDAVARHKFEKNPAPACSAIDACCTFCANCRWLPVANPHY